MVSEMVCQAPPVEGIDLMPKLQDGEKAIDMEVTRVMEAAESFVQTLAKQ
jgi:hypothetical protein